VIDVVPTILEACKLPAPEAVDGIKQKPIEGISMLYSFDDGAATGRRTTQYFEMMTNRAIYKDGWLASSRFGLTGQSSASPFNCPPRPARRSKPEMIGRRVGF